MIGLKRTVARQAIVGLGAIDRILRLLVNACVRRIVKVLLH